MKKKIKLDLDDYLDKAKKIHEKKLRFGWSEEEMDVMNELAASVVRGETSQNILTTLFKESLANGIHFCGLDKSHNAFKIKLSAMVDSLTNYKDKSVGRKKKIKKDEE